MHQTLNGGLLQDERKGKNSTLIAHTDYKAAGGLEKHQNVNIFLLKIKKISNLPQSSYPYNFMQNHSNDLRRMLNNTTNKFDIFILLLSKLQTLSFSLGCGEILQERLNKSLYFNLHSQSALLEIGHMRARKVIYLWSYFNHGR